MCPPLLNSECGIRNAEFGFKKETNINIKSLNAPIPEFLNL
jgi:hypothetical protein